MNLDYEVWSVHADYHNYPVLYIKNEADFHRLVDAGKWGGWSGISIAHAWTDSIDLSVDRDHPSEELPDLVLLSVGAPSFAMRAETADLVRSYFGHCGEFLPARVDERIGEQWVVFHLLTRRAVADWTKSRRLDPLGQPHKLVFFQERLSRGDLLLEDEYPYFWLTVEPDGFKAFAKTHKLSGLVFNKEFPVEQD